MSNKGEIQHHINDVADDEISLVEIFVTLWKRRWLIVFVNIFLILSFSAFYVFFGKTYFDKLNAKKSKIELSITSFLMEGESYNNISSYMLTKNNIKKVKKISNTKINILIKKSNISINKTILNIIKDYDSVSKLEYLKYLIYFYKNTFNKYEEIEFSLRKNKRVNSYEFMPIKILYREQFFNEFLISINNFLLEENSEKNMTNFINKNMNTIILKISNNTKNNFIKKDLEKIKVNIVNILASVNNNKNLYSYSYSVKDKKTKTTVIFAVFIFLSIFLSLFLAFLLEYIKNNKDHIRKMFK